MPLFEIIWERINQFQGQPFHTIGGREFEYEIRGNIFLCNRTNRNIAKRNFEVGYNMWPVNRPGVFRNILQGPAYVWAVLTDERISNGEF